MLVGDVDGDCHILGANRMKFGVEPVPPLDWIYYHYYYDVLIAARVPFMA